MKPRYNVWIEKEGGVVLSRWRARLLQAIDESGSIRAAAERVGVPYRRAWEKVQEMEAHSHQSLVDTEVGGEGGGGARLTPAARDLVRRFREFESGLEEEIARRYRSAFGDPAGRSEPD